MRNVENRYVTVKPGDCLYSLAAQHGFTADTLKAHANNQALMEQRPDPTQLVPGDQVFIPEKKSTPVVAETGMRHRFRRNGTRTTCSLTCLDFDKPLKKKRFILNANGHLSDGTTDDNGTINLTLPATVKSATITVEDLPASFEFTLQLGGLDPIDTVTGQQQRLSNLGHYPGNIDGISGDHMKAAIRAFKIDQKLTVNDQLDPDALSQLNQLSQINQKETP